MFLLRHVSVQQQMIVQNKTGVGRVPLGSQPCGLESSPTIILSIRSFSMLPNSKDGEGEKLRGLPTVYEVNPKLADYRNLEDMLG